MTIQWFGQSCFKLSSKNGTVIVIDPFDSTLGYDQPCVRTDAVLMTHQHFDHNCPDTLTGNPKKIILPGEYEVDDVKIFGYSAYHDKKTGEDRGSITVFKIVMDDVEICHLSDIGHIPNSELYSAIGSVDVLMIPVGGYYTIDANEAMEIIGTIEPNMIIPMHYLTEKVALPIAPVNVFVEAANEHYDVSRTGKNTITVDKKDLKKRTRIFLLEYN